MKTSVSAKHAKVRSFLECKIWNSDIAEEVALEILASSEPYYCLEDLLKYGCICGMVPSLVYYSDTHKFFDLHYAEIEELREKWEDETGQPLKIHGDLKNYLTWFAFEEVAYQLANELGIS